ncbi:MAG: tRNA (adenosine(37)-N6)-threonylcarbamoyltransferase complex ATPase subunit type 1 TsaE [Rickettsiales bacterium]|nr:tRNA (adenosine(37)-N6)-threonylcarbamoyltransferase complex ATPase subunit type 1 TsaE [Rickettsiales bacterium]OUT44197.1 MAG: tRNA (adenosine(37)-N6)-threonylcarbamoyltransferase complex ATPase subunit type 1 TsaE [Pelagibacteraceae bacterium TMED13]|tara:strand:+ start:368 stop:808 length:441 start_codon:yes stop_codon:yes gene_type:complete
MKEHSKFFLYSLADTEKLAKKISKIIKNGVCLCLNGKLGIGKTTLVKFILEHHMGKKINVNSPTFSLVNVYETNNLRVWHYDLYRLNHKSEIYNLDIELALRDCTIIEWPEIIEDILPNDRINIYFDEINSTSIEISILSNKKVIL